MVMDNERDDLQRQEDGYDEYSEENRGQSSRLYPEQQAPPMSPLERALHVPTAMEENPVRELFTPGNLKMKTEIPPGLIIPLARAYVIAKKTGSAILTNFCFPVGTKILIRNQQYSGKQGTSEVITKNIEEITENDDVLSYDIETSDKVFKKAVLGSRESGEFVTVKFSNGNALRMTPEHPVAVVENGSLHWVMAGNLKTSMRCIQMLYPDVEIIDIVNIEEDLSSLEKVYNLEVADTHTYFAHGILVHNCDEILLLQISKDRRGRIEFMESIVSSRSREDDLD